MYDRSAIMTAAWNRARRDGWAKASPRSRRAIFANALRSAWAIAAYDLGRAKLAAKPLTVAERIRVIECRTDLLTRNDLAEIEAIRAAA